MLCFPFGFGTVNTSRRHGDSICNRLWFSHRDIDGRSALSTSNWHCRDGINVQIDPTRLRGTESRVGAVAVVAHRLQQAIRDYRNVVIWLNRLKHRDSQHHINVSLQ